MINSVKSQAKIPEINAILFPTPWAEVRQGQALHQKLITSIRARHPDAGRLEASQRAERYLVHRWLEFLPGQPLRQATREWLLWVDSIAKTVMFRDGLKVRVSADQLQVSGVAGADLAPLVDLCLARGFYGATVSVSGPLPYRNEITERLEREGVTVAVDSPGLTVTTRQVDKKKKSDGRGRTGGQAQAVQPEKNWDDLSTLVVDDLMALAQDAADDGDFKLISEIQSELHRRQLTRLTRC